MGMLTAVRIKRIVHGPDMRVLVKEGGPQICSELQALIGGELTRQGHLEAPRHGPASALIEVSGREEQRGRRCPRR